jgi:diguanylate cyclase (GGDEF)-like protein/PAS domain S-box-containing protein
MQNAGPGPVLGSLAIERARALLADPAARPVFDRLVRLASLVLRAPAAVLAAVDDGELTLVAQTGAPEPWPASRELLRQALSCRSVTAAGEAFVVEDPDCLPARPTSARSQPSPCTAFCGAPVLLGETPIAVLAVGDVQPRRWTAEDAALVRDLAAAAVRDMELLADRPGPRPAREPGRAPEPAPTAVPPPSTRAAPQPSWQWAAQPPPSRPQPPHAAPAPSPATPPQPAAAPPPPPQPQPQPAAGPQPETPDGLVRVDAEWRVTAANRRAEELMGLPAAEVAGRRIWDVYPALIGTVLHHELVRGLAEGEPRELEEYCRSLDRWLEVRTYPAAGGGAAIYLRDVSARRKGQEELRGREARYRRLFEDSRTPLIVLSAAGALLEANGASAELLGRPRGELLGATLAELSADPEAAARLLEELAEHGTAEVEMPLRRPGGTDVVVLVSGGAHEAGGSTVYHGAMRDITVLKRAQEETVRTAFRDPLTGLPNRVVFMDRLERLLRQSKRRVDYRFAVLFLDLDNFKQVNDTHGHLVGDQLLVAVARRLEGCIRQEDTVARLGGDEFAVLLDTVQDTPSVMLVVERIRDALREPFSAEGREAGATVSIGIALSATGYERAEDLLRDADVAMYRAKSSGRDDYIIFDSDMQERALRQRQLEEDLRSAMDARQLALHYHPVVDLDGGAVTGLEALIRWSHPQRGLLLPAEFMPIAEWTGLIVEIGWWVLYEACRQLREWQLEYPDATFRMTMSVNLSAKQFAHPRLVQCIDEILKETALPPECLRLDVTEAVVMRGTEQTAKLLARLHERGIRICIDDFGTGFTSLQQLREFPISVLKIDGSFVRQLDGPTGGVGIVQSIMALGKSMSIDAIAEGVETPEQLEQLRRLGTRFAQGFLFCEPLDPRAAAALLAETRRR